METVKQYPSSFNKTKDVQKIKFDQPTFPVWFAIAFLIVCFFILKSFIYTPDEKRHGK